MKKLLILALLLTFTLTSCIEDSPQAEVVVESTPTPAATTSMEMETEEMEGEVLSPTDTPLQLIEGGEPPAGAAEEFSTDFSLHSVAYDEFLSGGPAKDGIPALDDPAFVSIADASIWLAQTEPVVIVEVEGVAKAYPIQILTWHEIVNDEVNGVGVTVTFCPLCNSALVYARELDGAAYDFGTTGRLRSSNLVMYDRQTESWWQQATGEALVGELVGAALERIPASMTSFSAFKERYPTGEVLSNATGYLRDYGSNPYEGYDTAGNIPFLFDGALSDDLDAMEHILAVEIGNTATAYAFSLLAEEIVINDTVADVPVVVFWLPGTNTALGASTIANGADVGAANAFERTLDGQELSFAVKDGMIFDFETGTTWDIHGYALKGALEGQRLTPVNGANHFWFSWYSFHPYTAVYGLDLMEAAAAEVGPGEVSVPYNFPINTYQGFDRSTVALTDMFQNGQPAIVNFFASGCPICVIEMDHLEDAYQEFGDSVNFVAIDIGAYVGLGTNQGAIELLADKGSTFPAGNTSDIQVLREYAVLGTPTTVFFNSDGSVSQTYTGLLSYDQFVTYISALN